MYNMNIVFTVNNNSQARPSVFMNALIHVTIDKAYLHAAICRANLSAPRNRQANRRV